MVVSGLSSRLIGNTKLEKCLTRKNWKTGKSYRDSICFSRKQAAGGHEGSTARFREKNWKTGK
jgi:hypothetical protein